MDATIDDCELYNLVTAAAMRIRAMIRVERRRPKPCLAFLVAAEDTELQLEAMLRHYAR